MKKITCLLLVLFMIFQFTALSFAKADEDMKVLDAAKEIQNNQTEQKKDNKKVSDEIDQVNESVVAIIGNNTKYRDQDEVYSKYPKNLQHGSGVFRR